MDEDEDEGEWQIVHEPKSFPETILSLIATFRAHAPHQMRDSDAEFLRDIRIEAAVEMLQAAQTANERSDEGHAWYFLTRAAEAIGYLVASKGAVYPHAEDNSLQSSLRKAGSKGGKAKGVNSQKVFDSIAEKILDRPQPKGGWTKDSMRRAYNAITGELTDYKDADRKWRALLKRQDIQSALMKPAQ